MPVSARFGDRVEGDFGWLPRLHFVHIHLGHVDDDVQVIQVCQRDRSAASGLANLAVDRGNGPVERRHNLGLLQLELDLIECDLRRSTPFWAMSSEVASGPASSVSRLFLACVSVTAPLSDRRSSPGF